MKNNSFIRVYWKAQFIEPEESKSPSSSFKEHMERLYEKLTVEEMEVLGAVFMSRGLNYAGQAKEAEEFFRKMLQYTGDSFLVDFNTGVFFDSLGSRTRNSTELNNARDCYTRALTKKSLDVDVLNNLGTLELELGNTQGALQILDKAVKHYENHAPTHNNLALALELNGQTTLALNHFEKAIELDSDLLIAHANMIHCLYLLGDVKRAVEIGEKGLKRNCMNTPIRHNLEALGIGYKMWDAE